MRQWLKRRLVACHEFKGPRCRSQHALEAIGEGTAGQPEDDGYLATYVSRASPTRAVSTSSIRIRLRQWLRGAVATTVFAGLWVSQEELEQHHADHAQR